MPSENAAAVAFELTLDDYQAFQVYACRPVKRPPWPFLLLLVLVTVATVVTALRLVASRDSFMVGFFVANAVVGGYSLLIVRRARGISEPMPNGCILCRQEYWVEDEGLRQRTPHWDGVTRWSGILRVEETEHHLFLMLDRVMAYIVPKRAFASPADAASFAERVRARLGGR
jgi:hypothetical protein